MKLFITISKKTLGAVLCGMIIAAISVSWYLSIKQDFIDGSTNAMRMDYLKSLGIEACDSSATSKDTVIPESFNNVYKNYNALQKKAEFDLADFKGKPVTVYTYPLADSEYSAHLIVSDGKIIGGDISSPRLDGKMYPLVRNYMATEI